MAGVLCCACSQVGIVFQVAIEHFKKGLRVAGTNGSNSCFIMLYRATLFEQAYRVCLLLTVIWSLAGEKII